MDIREFSNLIEKYKRGEISPREKELLESVLDSCQTDREKWIENEMGDKKIIEERILSRILRDINKERFRFVDGTFFSPSVLARAAAIAFFFILSSGLLYLSGIFSEKTSPAVWHEEVTSAGEKATIILSDGSQVILNADSKLKYPDRFGDIKREVFLEGEGYFVVRHIENRPFILHTGTLSTTVLGTKFNVSAYPDNKTIAVSLLEGTVRVSRSEKGTTDTIVVLKPKERLMYDKENRAGSCSPFDSLSAVGWKDNIFKFENEPLADVLPRLERAFGIEFIIADRPVLAQKVTVKFENSSLQTVVGVLKNLTGLDYEVLRDKDKIQEVVFFRNAR
jgi:transmembrane sensor